MPVLATLVAASGTLTASGAISNGETVVIGGKTYTFKTTITTADGDVDLGADDEGSLTNLYNAINLSGTAGTDYGTLTTLHPHVKATSHNATTVVVQAKLKGSLGNQIATTETGTNLAWGATTLAGGSGNVIEEIDKLQDYTQLNSEALQWLENVLNLGTND